MSTTPDANDYVYFSPPMIGAEEVAEVVDTLQSDWITTGPKTRRFEAEFAASVQAPGALALSSCTAGLHIALLTHGIGRGDEVITTPITFAATCNVIEHVGAKPVLVDVEPDTLNIDPAKIEAAITPRTKAIMPVHFTGHPVELDAINRIAEAHKLVVIEDAAHAIPTSYRGRPIGSGKNLVAFSFYATKNLATAEGGMLTGDPELLDRARVFSLHGMTRDAWKRYGPDGSWRYDIALPGFKYNMTDIQASIGLHQLRKLPSFQQRRREIVQRYNEAFAGNASFELPAERSGVDHAWHLYVLRLKGPALRLGRDRYVEEMKARKILTSVHFIPIHLHSYYRDKYGYKPNDFPVAYDAFQRMFSLPLSPRLTDVDQGRVINAVLDIASSQRRMAA